jgi:hypothetical protein
LLGVRRDHTFAIILTPEGPEKTTEHIHLYYATPKPDAALRRRNRDQWKEVFEEDIFVVEGMQRGRPAPDFDGGRFSPKMDSATHCFHVWVTEKIEAHRNQHATSE